MERIHSELRVLHIGQPSGEPLPVRVMSRNTSEIEVLAESPVPSGAAVSLHLEGGLVLAEIAGCSRISEREYSLLLSIDQVIPSLSELQTLMSALMQAGGSRSSDSVTRTAADRR